MRITCAVVVLLLLIAAFLAPLTVPSVAQDSLTGGACIGTWGDTRKLDEETFATLKQASPPRPQEQVSPSPSDALRYLDTGAPVSTEDYNPGVDIQSVDMQFGGAGIVVTYLLAGRSVGFPYFVRLGLDLSNTSSPPGFAYEFGGTREDVALFAQIDGPGRGTLQRTVGAVTRTLDGSVQVSEEKVAMTIPLKAAVGLGVVSPGIRVSFRAVGPPPKRVSDRVPKLGWIQIGIRGQMSIDPGPIVGEKFDLVPGGKDVLYYLDMNRDGLIDAIARDRNGDGRINFLQSEGPVVLIGAAGQPVPFSSVQQNTVDNRKAFLALASQFAYFTLVQDLNGDGDVADEGEFRSWLLRR